MILEYLKLVELDKRESVKVIADKGYQGITKIHKQA